MFHSIKEDILLLPKDISSFLKNLYFRQMESPLIALSSAQILSSFTLWLSSHIMLTYKMACFSLVQIINQITEVYKPWFLALHDAWIQPNYYILFSNSILNKPYLSVINEPYLSIFEYKLKTKILKYHL